MEMIFKMFRWLRWLLIYNEYEDVRDLHRKFGILQFREPGHLSRRKARERVEFLSEEVAEFNEAIGKQDLAKIADALVDIVYVAKGTALMYGLPWQDHWNEVHVRNMAKVRGVGPRGHAVDLVKPPGWTGPDHERILFTHGYRVGDWKYSDNHLFCRPGVARHDNDGSYIDTVAIDEVES